MAAELRRGHAREEHELRDLAVWRAVVQGAEAEANRTALGRRVQRDERLGGAIDALVINHLKGGGGGYIGRAVREWSGVEERVSNTLCIWLLGSYI